MGFSATPKFPAAVAAVGDLLNQSNRLASNTQPTLATAITSLSTTITAATGTGAIMATDNFVITIENEFILIATRTGDTLTVATRGYQGTAAASHSAGVNIDSFVMAQHHNQLAAEVNAIETQLGVNLVNVVLATQIGAINGVATLDSGQHLTASQIPPATVLISQSNAYSSGTKQSFAPSASAGAGVNVGAAGAVPSAPADGDFLIDATTYLLKWRITPAAPAAPTLGSAVAGALAATTYFVKVTGIINGIESAASAESSRAVLVNNVLTVTSPPSTAFDHYNVYVSTTTGTETKQTATPIATGTNWTEPTSGLISGAAFPTSGSGWMATTNPSAVGTGGGAVTSVFGRTGVVVAATNDYAFSQISGTLAAAQLPTQAVRNDQANTWSTGSQDFGAAQMVLPKTGTDVASGAGQVFINAALLKYWDNQATPVKHVIEVQDNKDVANGYFGLDSSGHANEAATGVYPKFASFTAVVVNAAVSTAQNMIFWSVPAGYLNITTRAIRVTIGGDYSTSGSAQSLTLNLAFLNVQGIGNGVFSVPASQTGNGWEGSYIIACAVTGTSGSFNSTGRFSVQGATAPNTAPVSHFQFAMDMTAGLTLQTQATFSVSSTSNICRQYFMIVERLNW